MVIVVLWWLVYGGSSARWLWGMDLGYLFICLQLCCGCFCLILCSCGGLECFPAWVINWGVGVLGCCLVREFGIVGKKKITCGCCCDGFESFVVVVLKVCQCGWALGLLVNLRVWKTKYKKNYFIIF